jgi:sec-independent protein translocase protein TatB
MADVTDAVHGRESESSASSSSSSSSTGSTGGTVDMTKKREKLDQDERPPFDADAT